MHVQLDNGLPCEVFDPFDDETRILHIQALRASWFKRCFLLPFIALPVFPLLFLYWSISFQKWLLYTSSSLEHASHLFITGASSTLSLANA